jgi:hypothetical protein
MTIVPGTIPRLRSLGCERTREHAEADMRSHRSTNHPYLDDKELEHFILMKIGCELGALFKVAEPPSELSVLVGKIEPARPQD